MFLEKPTFKKKTLKNHNGGHCSHFLVHAVNKTTKIVCEITSNLLNNIITKVKYFINYMIAPYSVQKQIKTS